MLRKIKLVPLLIALFALGYWGCKTAKKSSGGAAPTGDTGGGNKCVTSLGLSSASDWLPQNLDPSKFQAIKINAIISSDRNTDVFVDFELPQDLATLYPDYAYVQACSNSTCQNYFKDLLSDLNVFSSFAANTEYVQAKACVVSSRVSANGGGDKKQTPTNLNLVCGNNWSNKVYLKINSPQMAVDSKLAQIQEGLEDSIKALANSMHAKLTAYVTKYKLTSANVTPQSFDGLVYTVSQMPVSLYAVYAFSPEFEDAGNNNAAAGTATGQATRLAGDTSNSNCVTNEQIKTVDDPPTEPEVSKEPVIVTKEEPKKDPPQVTPPVVEDNGVQTCPEGQKLADPSHSGVMLCWQDNSPVVDPQDTSDILGEEDVLYPDERKLGKDPNNLIALGGVLIGAGALGLVVSAQFGQVSTYQQTYLNRLRVPGSPGEVTRDSLRRYFNAFPDVAAGTGAATRVTFWSQAIKTFRNAAVGLDRVTGHFIVKPGASLRYIAKTEGHLGANVYANGKTGKYDLKILENGVLRPIGPDEMLKKTGELQAKITRGQFASAFGFLGAIAAIGIGAAIVDNKVTSLAAGTTDSRESDRMALRAAISDTSKKIRKLKTQYLKNGYLIDELRR